MMVPLPALIERVADCQACSLRGAATTPVAGSGQPGQLFLVLEQPDREGELLGEPLLGRAGKLFRNLLGQADITGWYATYMVKCPGEARKEHVQTCKRWLWSEIQAATPSMILTLGLAPAQLLLRLPTSMRLADVAGKLHSVPWSQAAVAVWYSPQHLLSRGRQSDRDTVDFLRRMKRHAEDNR